MAIDSHFAEEELESYACGTLQQDRLGRLEEHLLICQSCRERVTTMDKYVTAMKEAAAQIRKAEAKTRATGGAE